MKAFQKLIFPVTAVALSFALGTSSQAQVYLDSEIDPIPLFEIYVTIPRGSTTSNPQAAVNYSLIQSLMDAGTLKLKREAYLDKLADFGASSNFSMSSQYATWTLSFPYQEGKDYQKLISILKDNWDNPRFTQEEFKRYQTMSINGIKASLNNDSQLAAGTARRWLLKKAFGYSPVFLDQLSKAKLSEVKKLYFSEFHRQKSLWAGYLGPQNLQSLAKDFISKIFGISDFVEGKYLQKFPTSTVTELKDLKPSRELLIVSKPGRTQNMTALISLSPKKLTGLQDELNFLIGDHVSVSGGLGSLYGEALRTRGGFSYTVASTASNSYLGYPVLGFFSNPMSSKQDAAMKTIADLIKDTYKEGHLFSSVPSSDWNRQVKSFRYEKLFDQMTPGARLGERQSVVFGSSSVELYKSDPLNWDASKEKVEAFYKAHWKDSQSVLAIVGDPKELKAVAAKYFPDFNVRVINYTDVVLSKTFD